MKKQRIVMVHFTLDSQLSNSVLSGQMFYKRSLLFVCLCIYAVFFKPCHKACGILVPGPEIKPVPHTVESQSLSPRTAREVMLKIRTETFSKHMFKITISPRTESSPRELTGENPPSLGTQSFYFLYCSSN